MLFGLLQTVELCLGAVVAVALGAKVIEKHVKIEGVEVAG